MGASSRVAAVTAIPPPRVAPGSIPPTPRRRPAEAFPALRAPRRSRGARPAGPPPPGRGQLDLHLRLRRLPVHRRHPGVPPERGWTRARPRRRARSADLTTSGASTCPLARVPRHVRAAFIAVEDRRFYYHHGVDWRSAARALVRNLREADVSEGFSTITMQVVRNAFVPRLAQQRSLRRKLIEIYLAHRLERSLTKQQILALYLNVIYLGNGAYGVEAASRDLFGKSVDRLTVAEGATLAALARGPSVYAPRRHPDRAVARRNLVLTVMAREHYLSDAPPRGLGRRRSGSRRARGDRARIARSRSTRCAPWSTRCSATTSSATSSCTPRSTPGAARRRGRRAAPGRRDRPRQRRSAGTGEGTRHAAGRAGGARSAERRDPGARGRAALRAGRVQPRARRAAATGLRLQAVRLRRGPRRRDHAGRGRDGHADRDHRARPHLAPGQLRRHVRRPPHAPPRAHALRQRRHGAAGRGRRRASGGGARPPRRHPEPARRGAGARARRRRGDAARAGHGLRPVRQRGSPGARRRSCAASRRATAPCSGARPPAGRARARRGGGISAHVDAGIGGGRRHRTRWCAIAASASSSRARPARPTTAPTSGSSATRRPWSPPSGSGTTRRDRSRPPPRAAASPRRRGRRSTWTAGASATPTDWTPPAGMVSRTIDAFNGDLANEWCPVTQREWFRPGTEPTRICREHSAPFVDRLEEFGRKLGKALKDLLGL